MSDPKYSNERAAYLIKATGEEYERHEREIKKLDSELMSIWRDCEHIACWDSWECCACGYFLQDRGPRERAFARGKNENHIH